MSADSEITLSGDMPRAPDLASDARSPIADPGARLAAVLIDTLLPFAPQLLALFAGALLGSGTIVRAGSWLGGGLTVLFFVIDLVLLHRFGQSIGKRVMGLRIVRTSGERASLGRLFWLRTVLPGAIGVVPVIGWAFGLADTLAIFSTDRQTLHDRIADTIVVDLRARAASPKVDDVFR
jgi:uncharacterized RDD family membrane protein YckC